MLSSCYIAALTSKSFLSFELFHPDKKIQVFALKAFELGLISTMRLDGRRDIMSVKSTWSTLHPELKACVPPCPRGITKEIKQIYT